MKHPFREHQPEIDKFAKDRGITYLGLFGSYARGEQKESSDVDLLVNFSRRISLLDLVNTERKLSQLIGVPVDLIPEKSLNKHVRPYVLNDLVTLHEER